MSDEPLFHESWDARTASVMLALNVRTWNDLSRLTPVDLLKIKGFGRVRLDAVRRRLSARGLAFADCSMLRYAYRHLSAPSPICGVYFVTADMFVKIGYATDIRKRLGDIRQHNPHECELVGYRALPTDKEARALEGELHRRFAAYRHRLEWFHFAPEIDAYVRSSCQP